MQNITNLPLVSVVIPFFKNVNWLEQAIKSALYQSYKNIEIIIINDCSIENIEELRVKYLLNVKFYDLKKNQGSAVARNEGILVSNGDFIAFLDSDDLWSPDKIKGQLDFMIENNYVWSQHSFYAFFGENFSKKYFINTRNFQGHVLPDTFLSFKVNTSTVMVRKKELLANSILFPSEFREGQDGEFYKDLALLFPLGYASNAISYFRRRPDSTGFRPSIQLKIRGMIFLKYQNNGYKKNIYLCVFVRALYAYCYLFSRIFKLRKLKSNHSKLIIECICGFFYLVPYLGFKIFMYIPNIKNKCVRIL